MWVRQAGKLPIINMHETASMTPRTLIAVVAIAVFGLAAWLRSAGQTEAGARWTEVAPGVMRAPAAPAGYALLADGKALLIDAPHSADGLSAAVEGVLLTHYHRDSVRATDRFLKNKIPVRAPKKADEWLDPEKVRKYWIESLPLRNSRTAYLVVPQGFDNVDYSLIDGQKIGWRDWSLQIIDTPGHARSQVAILAQRKKGRRILFCGGAFASAG